jgi:DNA transposition AAA+ family ATPase
MTSPAQAAFIETREYRRFVEFCDSCCRYRYIGLCYGAPGVGKTLSARHYADWDRVAFADPYADRGVFRTDEVPGNGCVLYTATVVNSPRQIEDDIASARRRMHSLVLQAIRTETRPVITDAQRKLDEERDEYFVKHDWLAGKSERLQRAEDAVSEAILEHAERSRGASDPTKLLLVDEVDRLRMSGLEQLRAVFDRGDIGLVLIGMPGLEKRLARYPQLYSRIGFVHEFRALSHADVRQLLKDRWSPPEVSLPDDGLADEESIAMILRVTGGNFRLLHRLLTQIGRVLELNKLPSVTTSVVEAARESLVIGTA